MPQVGEVSLFLAGHSTCEAAVACPGIEASGPIEEDTGGIRQIGVESIPGAHRIALFVGVHTASSCMER